MADDNDLVPVFDISDPAILPLIKSLLADAEIGYVIQGEEAMSLFPVGEVIGPFTKRGLAARILVRPEDAREAVELLSGLRDD